MVRCNVNKLFNCHINQVDVYKKLKTSDNFSMFFKRTAQVILVWSICEIQSVYKKYLQKSGKESCAK